jgi:hypothetical protein
MKRITQEEKSAIQGLASSSGVLLVLLRDFRDLLPEKFNSLALESVEVSNKCMNTLRAVMGDEGDSRNFEEAFESNSRCDSYLSDACRNCIFWSGYVVENYHALDDSTIYGECMRHAPTPKVSDEDPFGKEDVAWWPQTAQTRICGEYQRRRIEKYKS